jgi:hypothetical protein
MWKNAGRAPSLRVFTLAFALQLRKKHRKTTVRLRETSVRLIKTSVRNNIRNFLFVLLKPLWTYSSVTSHKSRLSPLIFVLVSHCVVCQSAPYLCLCSLKREPVIAVIIPEVCTKTDIVLLRLSVNAWYIYIIYFTDIKIRYRHSPVFIACLGCKNFQKGKVLKICKQSFFTQFRLLRKFIKNAYWRICL